MATKNPKAKKPAKAAAAAPPVQPGRRGRGRPRIPGLARERLFLRVHQEELQVWQGQAGRIGVPLSTWIRMTCNNVARHGG